jgi:hypothetical protein
LLKRRVFAWEGPVARIRKGEPCRSVLASRERANVELSPTVTKVGGARLELECRKRSGRMNMPKIVRGVQFSPTLFAISRKNGKSDRNFPEKGKSETSP